MKNYVKLAEIKKLAASELTDCELSKIKGGTGPIIIIPKKPIPIQPCYGIPTATE